MTQLPHAWLRRLTDGPALAGLAGAVRAHSAVQAAGVWGSSPTLVAGALAVRLQRPVLLVVAHLDDADDAYEDLALFTQAGYPLECDRFPALEVLPGETSASLELLSDRLAVVEHLLSATPTPAPSAKSEIRNQKSQILTAPIQALMQPVPTPAALGEFSLTLQVGKNLPPARLLDWLDRTGYQRVDAIEQPGDFTTRGGIVDVYLPSNAGSLDDHEQPLPGSGPLPVRIDYFGDEVDSLSVIDTDTMGSTTRLHRASLIGASLTQMQAEDRTTGLLSLLPADTLIVLREPLEIAEQARGYYERLTNPRGIISPQTLLRDLTSRAHVRMDPYGQAGNDEASISLPVRPLPDFAAEAAPAVEELLALREQQPVVLCSKSAEADRLRELLSDVATKGADAEPPGLSNVEGPGLSNVEGPGLSNVEGPGLSNVEGFRAGSSSDTHAPAIPLEVGYLHRGFIWEEPSDQADGGFLIVPNHELFHRYQTRRRIRRVSAAVERAADAFLDLSPGDAVVHSDHGIARFVELRTLRRGKVSEDYLTLEFAQGALLHVPAAQIDLVQKYVGGFAGKPPLSVLGGKRWARQKQDATEAVKDLAGQMLRLQAARASLPGVRFPADTLWQKEFEASFPYDETPDQLAAIAETKKDMGDHQPMDRLICGDVGFGKTEVAVRAAFKAMEFGKQVAVLVPTTVLAEQHERTFRGRMAEYPFRVESLSRFKTGAEQAKILRDLAEGKLDLVIGTHRLLSQDVQFKDLGLVVIDEEQRFGVEHKDRLLRFRLTADVLTLSATPIPRTLHMALLGLRHISSLSTPPADRRAIVTEVLPYEKDRLRLALERELARDGQVYFVHNRIHDLHTLADEIQALAPSARIVVGHGQMPGHELEEVMLRFMRRQADILVCTTIIESGLDIPTANTMFIHDADQYGLADLHQLRGRVGRWKHRAYCYLLLPQDRPVTDQAARRLKAIEQYSMLGAGFKIAMRDLEIRGAGNILGKEQSGHIAAVGYDMYCRLLEQEARKLRQEKIVEPNHTALELPLSGRIPKTYIPSDKHRMDAYRRISRSTTLAELDAVAADLADAYGKTPEPVQRLLDLAELRLAAGLHEISVIQLQPPDVIFTTTQPQKLDVLLRRASGRATLVDEKTVYYRPPPSYLDSPATLLAVLRKLLVEPLRPTASAV